MTKSFMKELERKEYCWTGTYRKKRVDLFAKPVLEQTLSKKKKDILEDIHDLTKIFLSKNTLPKYMNDFSRKDIIKKKEVEQIIKKHLK